MYYLFFNGKCYDKKNILYLTLIGTFVLSVVFFESEICGFKKCPLYWDKLPYLFVFILPVLLPLLFSLITYRLPDAVFTHWWHFTRWFIPLSMFLVLIAPGKGGDAIPTPEFGPIIFIFMMTIYLIISSVKIIRAYRNSKT